MNTKTTQSIQVCLFFCRYGKGKVNRKLGGNPLPLGNPMAIVSLSRAAALTGKSKPTISKAIKTGRLSAKKLKVGYEIDTSELFRVYPKETAILPKTTSEGLPSVALLELELKMLRQQLEREQETTNDLRTRLDSSQRLIESQQPTRRKWFWQG